MKPFAPSGDVANVSRGQGAPGQAQESHEVMTAIDEAVSKAGTGEVIKGGDVA